MVVTPVGSVNELEFDSDCDSYIDDNEQYVNLSDETEEDYVNYEQNISFIDKLTVNRYFIDNNIAINKIFAGTFHSLCMAANGFKC